MGVIISFISGTIFYFTAESAESAEREICLNYNKVMFGQKLTEQGVTVEAGGLVKVIYITCSGFFRFVQAREVVSLFIPGCGIINRNLDWSYPFGGQAFLIVVIGR